MKSSKMVPSILAVLTIFFLVGVNVADETQQQVHHHRVTGQPTYVTRVHRYTYQQTGEGGGAGVGGQASQGVPQQNVHVHRFTGKPVTRVHRFTGPGQQLQQTSQEPTSQVVYEEISGPTSQVYEEISGPSSQYVYEEISGPTSQVYEEISGSTSSGSYEEVVSQGSYEELVSQVVSGQISQGGAPELRSNYDASLKNGGYSFEGAFGVNQRRRCNRGLIDKTATGIRDTVNGGVGNLMEAISSLTDSGTALGPVGGLVNAVGHAGGHLIQGKLNEIDFMINDAACGLGNVANAAADMLKTGDVVGGVGTIGKELLGGVGNMGEDFLSQAASGIGNAANDLLGFLGG